MARIKRVMDANLIERIESGTERGAAALFGGAIAYAVLESLRGFAFEPQRAAYAAAAGIGAFLLCSLALKSAARGESNVRIPIFDLREFDEFAPDELLLTDKADGELLLTERAELLLTDADRMEQDDVLILTDADRLQPNGVLVLDQVRAELADDSRVVRLFDRHAMPTPGELKSRIDEHLEQGSAASDPLDASQALSDALAELKRSLR